MSDAVETGRRARPVSTVLSLVQFDQWQRRIDLRGVLRRSRSLPGALSLSLPLLLAPAMFLMMRDGPFAVASASPSQILGSLIIGHLALGLAFAALAWQSLATGLVLRFQHAPLRAHPAVLPLAVLHEVVAVGIARSAGFVLLLLYGLHWRLLRTIITSPLEWAVHVALMVMALAAVGVIVFSRVRRRILRASNPRERAIRANKRGLLGAMFVTFGGFGAEAILGQKAPWVLERIGDVGAAGAVFLVPPLHAVAATSALPGAAWLVLGAFSTVVLWRAAVLAAPSWIADLPVDLQSVPAFTAARLRSVIIGRGVLRRASAFAAKDLLLPVVRSPARHFVQQWFVFAGVAGVLIVARFAMANARDTAAPVLLPVVVALYALLQARVATLHLLGMEGLRIALLMPILPARLLVLLKGTPAILFVTIHTVAGAVLLLLLGTALGFSHIPVAGTLAVAIVAGAIAAALGVAIGFLLPDFERRSVGSPGATVAGRWTFSAIGGFGLGVFAMLQLVTHAASVPPAAMLVSLGALVAVIAALTVAIGYAGVQRLARLEI